MECILNGSTVKVGDRVRATKFYDYRPISIVIEVGNDAKFGPFFMVEDPDGRVFCQFETDHRMRFERI